MRQLNEAHGKAQDPVRGARVGHGNPGAYDNVCAEFPHALRHPRDVALLHRPCRMQETARLLNGIRPVRCLRTERDHLLCEKF